MQPPRLITCVVAALALALTPATTAGAASSPCSAAARKPACNFWWSTLNAAARTAPAEHFANTPSAEFFRRLHRAAARYGFQIVNAPRQHAAFGAPFMVLYDSWRGSRGTTGEWASSERLYPLHHL